MKKLFAIFALLTAIMTVTPAVTYAAVSPIAETKNPNSGSNEETPTKVPGGNSDSKSPQTGSDVTTACVVLIGAAGITLIAKKKVFE